MPKRKVKRSASKRKSSPRKTRFQSAGKPPKDAVTLVVICKARTGQELMLEAELKALVGPTRREAGCITYDLHRGADTPGAFLLHEIWVSRDAHKLHTQTPHFLRWSANRDAIVASIDSAFWKRFL